MTPGSEVLAVEPLLCPHQEQPHHDLNEPSAAAPVPWTGQSRGPKEHWAETPESTALFLNRESPPWIPEGSFLQGLTSCPTAQLVLWGLFHRCKESTMSSPNLVFIPPQTMHTFVVHSYIISFSHYQKVPFTLCFMAAHIFFPTVFINNLIVFWCLAVNFFGLTAHNVSVCVTYLCRFDINSSQHPTRYSYDWPSKQQNQRGQGKWSPRTHITLCKLALSKVWNLS